MPNNCFNLTRLWHGYVLTHKPRQAFAFGSDRDYRLSKCYIARNLGLIK